MMNILETQVNQKLTWGGYLLSNKTTFFNSAKNRIGNESYSVFLCVERGSL